MANPLKDKNIILGVTGSIAAYKACEIASKLTQVGSNVNVILTNSALEFISPLSFQSVTGKKAYTDEDLWGGEGHVTHIGLGHSADLLVIAPISANTLAKLANGIGDNLLSVTALAARCPVLLAPAMDGGMYSHPATQQNIEILKNRGINFIGPESGHLASGLSGVGRMSEPADVYNMIKYLMSRSGKLANKKVVVTAGPTRETIDPVRFITNRSSGKQGYALAEASLDYGADVVLITGKTCLPKPIGCKVIEITTAQEMLQQVLDESGDADFLFMAAAVADFKPKNISDQKIKKTSNLHNIEFESTQDILLKVAENKKVSGYPLITVGFAAESQDLLTNAKKKLQEKSLDMIVANDISSGDSGFEVDTNKVYLIFPDGNNISLPGMTKYEVAENVIRKVLNL